MFSHKIVVRKAVFRLSIASSVPEIFAIKIYNCCPKSSALLITLEPLHLAWWNFAGTCTLTSVRKPDNFKVIGQRSRSDEFFGVFGVRLRLLSLGQDDLVSFHFIHLRTNDASSIIRMCTVSQKSSQVLTTYSHTGLLYTKKTPYHLEDIIKIESVHRRFTKRIRGLSNVGYKDRLEILSLESLQLRRLHQDLISYSYKIIFGLIDIDCSRFFTVIPNETTRGHAYKLFVHHSRVYIRKHFFVIG